MRGYSAAIMGENPRSVNELAAIARAQLLPMAGELPWSNQAEITLEVTEAMPMPMKPGCGCNTGSAGPVAIWLFAMMVVASRRRRRQR